MAKMTSLNQEKRYFTMNYRQIKDWMENNEIWDYVHPVIPALYSRKRGRING